MTVFDNVKELRAWVIGAIAFDASVTTLLVTVFSVDLVKTTIATTATTLVVLAIIFLIYKSEGRSRNELQKHIIDDSYKKTGQNNINNIKEKIDSSMSDYLQNIFDEMNKDCFYIEPLLIPTQPSDGLNSVDPISKFMDTL